MPAAKLPIADFRTQADWHTYLGKLTPAQLKKVAAALNRILRTEFRLNTKKPAAELLEDVKKLYSVNNNTRLLEIVKGIDADQLPQPSQNLPKPTKKQIAAGKEADKARVRKVIEERVSKAKEDMKQAEITKKEVEIPNLTYKLTNEYYEKLTDKQQKDLEKQVLLSIDQEVIGAYTSEMIKKLVVKLAFEKGIFVYEKPKPKTEDEDKADFFGNMRGIDTKKMESLASQDKRRVKEQKQYDKAVEKTKQKGTITRAIARIGKSNPKFQSKKAQIQASAELINSRLNPKTKQMERSSVLSARKYRQLFGMSEITK